MAEWRQTITHGSENEGKVGVSGDINVDTSREYKKKELQMYWIDAFEDRFNHPGTIYLFGKVFYSFMNS